VWIYISLEFALDMAQAVIHQPLATEVFYIKLRFLLANDSVCSLQKELMGIQYITHTVWAFSQLPLTDWWYKKCYEIS